MPRRPSGGGCYIIPRIGGREIELLLGGQPRIVLEPAAGAFTQAGLGGGQALGVLASGVHVESYLLVGDAVAGHGQDLVWGEENLSCTRTSRPQARLQAAPPVGAASGRATPVLPPPPPANSVSLTGQCRCRARAERRPKRPSVRRHGSAGRRRCPGDRRNGP